MNIDSHTQVSKEVSSEIQAGKLDLRLTGCGDPMSKKKGYYFDLTPRWLKYSGLPKELNKKYGELAWSIFHCLIQLDCRHNPDYPNTFDQLFEEIADLTGITRRTVSKYIETFEKDKLITVKRGVRGRKSTFKLANPIKTPKRPKEIYVSDGGLLNIKGKTPVLRYADYGKDIPLIHDQIMGKTGNNYGNDIQNKGKDFPTNKRKIEEKRGKQQQAKKPNVVASFFNEKGKKSKCIVKERLHPALRDVAVRLTKLGIREDKALEFVCSHDYIEIEKQLQLLPYRKNVENPAGALIKAIENNWTEPPRIAEKIEKKKTIQNTILRDAKEDSRKGTSYERAKEWSDKLDPDYQKEYREFLKKQSSRGIAEKLSWQESGKYKGLYSTP